VHDERLHAVPASPNRDRSFAEINGPQTALYGRWIVARRGAFKKGKLSTERIAALESLDGWVWDPRDADYLDSLARLGALIQLEGQQWGRALYQERNAKIRGWVFHQRARHRNRELSAERITALESLEGWDWGREEEQ
jgi:hypothetical protein